jgi:predicted Zn-dependent protease
MNRIIVYITLFMLCISNNAFAQADPLTQARDWVQKKNYDKAADAYAVALSTDPANSEIYHEFLNALIDAKDFKTAEKLVNGQMMSRRQDPLLIIDLGQIAQAQGKDKKAEDYYNQSLQMLNGDDILTQQVAIAFTKLKREDYTLKTYERARDLLRNPYFYSGPLARLYAKTGAIDKAIYTLLETNPGQSSKLDDTKETMLEILGSDPKKQQQAQKALIKKINDQPENPFYAELLTWLYTQKDDWDGALIQVQALDDRNKEQGERLLEFARYATKENALEYSVKAYQAIVDKGEGQPYYSIALAEKLNVQFKQLQNDPAYKKETVTALEKEYAQFLQAYPHYYVTPTVRDYATLLAIYADKPEEAVEVLKKVIDQAGNSKTFAGETKLQLGDYYILSGKVWDASLIYSQVDKAFKEDALGEDARFRNAKLAYYRGDFEWAQDQLNVLKASTSELIANDALYLSVLITENITEDSNYVPIRRFAHADLLLFQNKDKEAEILLDSIITAFPEHPLKDDILMQKAKLAVKHREYPKALTYLKEIQDKFGKDVLGDDAIFRSGEIYQTYLHQNEDAKKYYEQLIIDYPGSTYVQIARTRLNELSGTPVLP